MHRRPERKKHANDAVADGDDQQRDSCAAQLERSPAELRVRRRQPFVQHHGCCNDEASVEAGYGESCQCVENRGRPNVDKR